MIFYYLYEKALELFTSITLPNLADYNNLDQQWLTVSITLITALVSMKLLFFTENWALHVKRDNSCFSHLIIPSKSLKVYRSKTIREKRVRQVSETSNSSTSSYTWTTPGRTRIKEIVNLPKIKNWRPLIVFANKKSGGGLGKLVIDEVSSILHPLQVHDLSTSPPQETLKILDALPNQQFTVLICGGDGTINWVMAAIDEIAPKVEPLIALLPLGTGNDLSRCFGWGSGYSRFDSVRSTLAALKYTDPVPLDRWKMQITETSSPKFGKKPHKIVKNLSFQNYFSIGIVAAVTYDFHRSRENEPIGILKLSRFVNKAWWGVMGAKNRFGSGCTNLSKDIELELDGKRVVVPEGLQGIDFLNAWSWGGGTPIWRQGMVLEDGDCFGVSTREKLDYGSLSDGKIEVVGFYDSIHLGQIIVNLSDPVRLGQCKTAKITINRTCPMQADGEPWMNQNCVIELQATRGRIMLKNKVDEIIRKRLLEKPVDRRRRLSSGSTSTASDCSLLGGRGDNSQNNNQNSHQNNVQNNHQTIHQTTNKNAQLSSHPNNANSQNKLHPENSSPLSNRATTPELLSQYNAIKPSSNSSPSVNNNNSPRYRTQTSNTSVNSSRYGGSVTPITEYEVTQFFETANNQ